MSDEGRRGLLATIADVFLLRPADARPAYSGTIRALRRAGPDEPAKYHMTRVGDVAIMSTPQQKWFGALCHNGYPRTSALILEKALRGQ
jgi:hypothetical protein